MKRKIKFKDGSTGSYTVKPTTQLTFIPCKICTHPLLTMELAMGDTCTKCLGEITKRKNEAAEVEQQIRAKQLEQEIFDNIKPSIVPTKVTSRFIEIEYDKNLYQIEILEGGFERIYVRDEKNEVILAPIGMKINCDHKLGREVLYYAKKNKLIPVK